MSVWTNYNEPNTVAFSHDDARATIKNTGKNYILNLWLMDAEGEADYIATNRSFRNLGSAKDFVNTRLGLSADVEATGAPPVAPEPMGKTKSKKRNINVISFGGREVSLFSVKCLVGFSITLIILVYLRTNPQDALAIRKYAIGGLGGFAMLSSLLLVVDIWQNGGKVTGKFIDYQIRRLKQ